MWCVADPKTGPRRRNLLWCINHTFECHIVTTTLHPTGATHITRGRDAPLSSSPNPRRWRWCWRQDNTLTNGNTRTNARTDTSACCCCSDPWAIVACDIETIRLCNCNAIGNTITHWWCDSARDCDTEHANMPREKDARAC